MQLPLLLSLITPDGSSRGPSCSWGIQIYDYMASYVCVGGGCMLGLVVCFLGGEWTATVSYKLYDRGPKGLN